MKKKNRKIKNVSLKNEEQSLIKEWLNNEVFNNPTEYFHPQFFENIKRIVQFGKRKELDIVINYMKTSENLMCDENLFWEVMYETCKNQIYNHSVSEKKVKEEIQRNWRLIQNNQDVFKESPVFWNKKLFNYDIFTEFEEDFSKTELKKMKLSYLFHHYKISRTTNEWLNPFDYLTINQYAYHATPTISVKPFIYREKFDDFAYENGIKENHFYEYLYLVLENTHLYKFIDIDTVVSVKEKDDLVNETIEIEKIYLFDEQFMTLFDSLIKEPKCFENEMDKKMFYIEQSFIKQLTNQNIDLTGKHYILHAGPTNAGKSYNALQSYYKSDTGCYLAPLRLLAYEIFDTLKEHDLKGSLLTGETKLIEEHSTHVAATVEMYQTLYHDKVDVLVIDECQMITDSQRGSGWLHAIVTANAKEIHLISAIWAIPLLKKYIESHNGTIEVKRYERLIPLEVMEEDITIYDLQKNDAVIAFSKNKILELVAEISNKTDLKISYLYGMMPPEIKMKQMDDFRSGVTDIIVTTDVIAMGLNLPIQRVVFSETSKFNGERIEVLQKPLYEQIAGRAGRFGQFDIGYVTFSWKANRYDVLDKNYKTHEFQQVVKQPSYEEFEEYLKNTTEEKTFLDYLIFWQDYVEYDTKTYKKANIKEIIEALESVDSHLLKQLSHKEQYFFAFLPYHKNRYTDFIANQLVDYYLNGNEFSHNQALQLIDDCFDTINSNMKDVVLESQYSHLQTISQYAYNTENDILIDIIKEEKEKIIKNWEITLKKVIVRKQFK